MKCVAFLLDFPMTSAVYFLGTRQYTPVRTMFRLAIATICIIALILKGKKGFERKDNLLVRIQHSLALRKEFIFCQLLVPFFLGGKINVDLSRSSVKKAPRTTRRDSKKNLLYLDGKHGN